MWRAGVFGVAFAFGLALLYVAVVIAVGDRLPRDTVIDGLPLGGQPRAEAIKRLTVERVDELRRPIQIGGPGESTAALVPADSGISTDVAVAVDSIPLPGWSPRALYRWLTLPVQRASALTVDDVDLAATVERQTTGWNRAAVEPTVQLVDGEATWTTGVPGLEVDVSATSDAVLQALEGDSAQARAVVHAAAPRVSDVTARATFIRLRDLVARGLSVQRDDVVAPVPRRALSRAISFVPLGDALSPVVDGERLRSRLLATRPDLEDPARSSSFRIRDGVAVLVPARAGETFAAQDLADAVALAAVDYPASGLVTVPTVPLAPALDDVAAARLGIRERLSAFTQEFPYAPYRVQNIGQAARYVNGTVVLSGEEFSMNDTIRERLPENGYTEGIVIGPGGVFREDLGGGVSTATTAVWTAAYFAGMRARQVQAHSVYIPRYAPGLEATVAWGVFDMRFRNESPTAVFITAKTTNTSITVEFWGTRQYDDITATFGPRRNVVPHGTQTDRGSDCLGQSGSDGFTIDVERKFIVDRAVVESETTTTTYKPSPQVICG